MDEIQSSAGVRSERGRSAELLVDETVDHGRLKLNALPVQIGQRDPGIRNLALDAERSAIKEVADTPADGRRNPAKPEPRPEPPIEGVGRCGWRRGLLLRS